MKAKIVFMVFFSVPVWLSAQRVAVSSTIEKTINCYQYGASVALELPSQWKLGGFYQTSFPKKEEVRPHEHFWGMTVTAPLVKTDRIVFYSNARIGIVNKYFLAVCPALGTELKLSKRFYLNVGMSIRKGYMSAQTSFSIKV